MAFQANMHRDTKNKPDPFKAVEFMNYTDYEEPKLSDDEIEAHLDRLFGG